MSADPLQLAQDRHRRGMLAEAITGYASFLEGNPQRGDVWQMKALAEKMPGGTAPGGMPGTALHDERPLGPTPFSHATRLDVKPRGACSRQSCHPTAPRRFSKCRAAGFAL